MVDRAASVRLAARNNAGWCDIVCRTHGIVAEFRRDAWSSARRTPPFYPDAVTLEQTIAPESLLARIDTAGPGGSIKDSFACLDLTPFGFQVLFEAEWIYRPADARSRTNGSGSRWIRVQDRALFARWEDAWRTDGTGAGVLLPTLLDNKAVTILAAVEGYRVDAGAVINRGESVLGISNIFSLSGNLSDAWTGCLAAVDRYLPGFPLVGYETGESLAEACERDFRSVGRLRVWMASET